MGLGTSGYGIQVGNSIAFCVPGFWAVEFRDEGPLSPKPSTGRGINVSAPRVQISGYFVQPLLQLTLTQTPPELASLLGVLDSRRKPENLEALTIKDSSGWRMHAWEMRV